MATLKLSTTVINAMLDAIESGAVVGQTTAIGTSPVLKLWGGTMPANCAAADATPSTNTLATITLGSDWASNASAGVKSFTSTPLTDASADNTGTLTHFRLYATGATVCHMQGTITATGGGGDMTVDNVSVTAGQQINVTSWSMNMSGHV